MFENQHFVKRLAWTHPYPLTHTRMHARNANTSTPHTCVHTHTHTHAQLPTHSLQNNNFVKKIFKHRTPSSSPVCMAKLLTEALVASSVAIEPPLQLFSGEQFRLASTITDDKAQLSVNTAAEVFWGSYNKALFDVRFLIHSPA